MPYHISAISLNMLDNAAAQALVSPDVYVVVYLMCVILLTPFHSQIFANNYPLPKTAVDQLDAIRTGPTGFNVAFLAIFALGFLQASFAVFLVTERVNKSKAIQFISGAQAWVFWLT